AGREWLPVFRERASEQSTSVVCSDASEVTQEELAGFRYFEHQENVSLALKVCEYFGVPRDRALEGMQNCNPDPGVLVAYHIAFQNKEILFFNAFAANDRDSTLLICDRLNLSDSRDNPLIIIINNRGDRLQRAEQFGQMMGGDLKARYFVLIGEFTRATQDIATRRGLAPDRILNMGNATPEKV